MIDRPTYVFSNEISGAAHLVHPLRCKAIASARPKNDLDITVYDSDGRRARGRIARKLARRCYHTLRDLGEDALLPA